jgi:chromatin remodeling complex protein RSC6
MADNQMQTVIAELADIKSSIKALAKLLRKLRNVQDDPDGEKAKTRASNNGFNRPLEVSEKLRVFLALGSDETISRSEVTRRINAYVTNNNLKHPDNGRVIILDNKLTELLEPPAGLEITFLNIQKYLSPHYVKPPKASTKAPKTPEPEPAPEPPATPKVKKVPSVKKVVKA